MPAQLLAIDKNKALAYTEYPILILCGLFIVDLMLSCTMIEAQLPVLPMELMFGLLIIVVIVRTLLQLRNPLTWAGIAVGVLYLLIWDRPYFPMLALLTLGCVGIPYRKVLKVFLISAGSVVAAAWCLAMSGCITDLIYMRDGELRSAAGITYPTHFATSVLFLAIAAWVFWDSLPEKLCAVFPLLSFGAAWFFARSRTSMACSVLLLAMILYRLFETKVIMKRERLRWIKKTADAVMLAAFPLCMLLIFGLTFCYARDLPFSLKVDGWMSGRLSWTLRAFQTFDITAFGRYISQSGLSRSVFPPLDNYTIDSSYPYILFCFGVVTLSVMCVLWILFTRRAIRANQRRLALALALIAFHSISEYRFFHFFFNIFLILPFAVLSGPQNGLAPERADRAAVTRRIVWIAGLGACLAALPKALSCLSLWGLRLEDRDGGRLILFLTAAIAGWLAILLLWGLGRLLGDAVSKRPVQKKTWCAVVPCAAALIALTLASGAMARKTSEDCSALLDTECDAVSTVTQAATGRVYVSRLGEVYARTFPGISRAPLGVEELARFRSTTVIVPQEMDSKAFTERGFQYGRISEEHGLYTNDAGVIEALNAAGYPVAGYCFASHEVELEQKLDGVVYIPAVDGAILLNDRQRAFNNMINNYAGETVDFFAGRYTVTFSLRIDPERYEQDYPVCTLAVDAYGGKVKLQTETVYRSWFDDRGLLDAQLVFSSEDYPEILFSVVLEEEDELMLSGITWQRTPL